MSVRKQNDEWTKWIVKINEKIIVFGRQTKKIDLKSFEKLGKTIVFLLTNNFTERLVRKWTKYIFWERTKEIKIFWTNNMPVQEQWTNEVKKGRTGPSLWIYTPGLRPWQTISQTWDYFITEHPKCLNFSIKEVGFQILLSVLEL